jgi:DHA2 family multidrug resistance protein-like MFS transporter
VAEGLPRSVADELVASAAHAFDGGVVVTALIGVALMVAAGIVAATTLHEPKGATSE